MRRSGCTCASGLGAFKMMVNGNRRKTAALRRRSKRRARAEVQGMSGLRSLSRTNTRDILTSPHREALTGQLPSDLGGRSSSPMLQAVSLVRPRHWLHPLHLFNREPQCFTKFSFLDAPAFRHGEERKCTGTSVHTVPLRGSIFGGNARNPTACAGKVFLAQLCDGFLCLPTTLA